ncbi:MAG TPA: site-2 protease family protein [Pyrinomonadaceae bacterium]|nr:site-2 protease family protein [Pyrinomonadaceae bacterium]HMP66365.1 site-2 protease family protein [Pyrinomonadaceae bacterium]
MEAQIKLGRILGIQIGLHYSWLIIAVLISLSLAAHFSAQNPDWGFGIIWLMAISTAILFFAAIVVHELSHAAVALRNGLPVRAITLFALGGVAQIEKEPQSAKVEFWMAIVGPITSAVIGIGFLTLATFLGWTPATDAATPLMAMMVWLGYINIALAVFNMIPGFPMDGGRVLRAVIWWITGNPGRATRGASIAGQVIAFIFIIGGLIGFFRGLGFGGLWIAFIGWFLLNAAKATYVQAEVTDGLEGVRVGDLMGRECATIDGRDNLQTVVSDHMLRTGRRCFIVTESSEPVGMITPSEITAVEERKWPFTLASDAMKPLSQLHTAWPDMPASEALDLLGKHDINQLPVIADGRLAGIISRDVILRYLVTRKELRK